MARVLAISSQVVRGHVGLGAAVPVLNRLGHEVWALPTILLSNHPGHPRFAGERIGTELLVRLRDALEENGWLEEVDAVLTGYLPSAAHVAFAVETITRLCRRRTAPLVLADPIIGDFPKGVYLEAGAADAIRDNLVPLADITTPNVFELGWLAGREVRTIEDAIGCAKAMSRNDVVVTSVPGTEPDRLANVSVSGSAVVAAEVRERPIVPRGTGDLFAGLLLGHVLNGGDRTTAMARAAAGVEAVLEASAGHDELRLVDSGGSAATNWALGDPLPVQRIA